MTRRVPLALALLGVALLAVGTGGFSSSTADRSVSVAVVDDKNALLKVDVGNKTAEADETGDVDGVVRVDNGNSPPENRNVPLITLENQADSSELTVAKVTAKTPVGERGLSAGRPPKISNVSAVSNADSTKRQIVAGSVVCANNKESEKTVIVSFTASSDQFTVELSRTVTVKCTGDPPENGNGNGNGNGGD